MVMPAVAVEVGVKARANRNPQFPGGGNRHHPERALGRYVYQVRTLLPPQGRQSPPASQPELQARVAWQGQAGYPHQVVVQDNARLREFTYALVPGLGWSYHLYLMAPSTQPPAQLLQGVGDAINLRGKGFRDDSDPARSGLTIGCVHSETLLDDSGGCG